MSVDPSLIFVVAEGKEAMGGWYQDVRTVRVRFEYEDLFFSCVPKENSKVSNRCNRGT